MISKSLYIKVLSAAIMGLFLQARAYADKPLQDKFITTAINSQLSSQKNYYANGQLCYDFFYKNSVPDSTMIFYYPNGKIRLSGTYKLGMRTGQWSFYYPDGSIEASGKCKYGSRDGDWEFHEKKGGKTHVVKYEIGNIKDIGGIPLIKLKAPLVAEAAISIDPKTGLKKIIKWRFYESAENLEEYAEAKGQRCGNYWSMNCESYSPNPDNMVQLCLGNYCNNRMDGEWETKNLNISQGHNVNKLETWKVSYKNDRKNGRCRLIIKEYNSSTRVVKDCNYRNDTLEGRYEERDPSRWYNLIESGMYKNGLKEGVWSHLAGSNFITENYLHGRKNGLAYEYENERDYLDRQPPYLVKTTTYRNDTSIAERNYIVDSGGTRFISSVSGLPGGNQVDSMYNYDPPKKTDLGKSYFSRNNFEMNRLDDEFILPGMEALVILSYKDYHLVHRKSFYKSGKLFSDCTYPFRKDSFYIKGEGSMQHSFSRTVRFDSIGKWNVWYENGNPYLEGTIKMFDGFNDPSYIYTSELQMLSESSWIVRDINGNIIEERTYHEGVLEKRIKKH